jgi:hypothetical protein
MAVFTAKEIIEHFSRLPENEEVLITWWKQSDFPDYDFYEGTDVLDSESVIGAVNDAMERKANNA